MKNIKRNERPSSKKFFELRSKILFIYNNIAKNSLSKIHCRKFADRFENRINNNTHDIFSGHKFLCKNKYVKKLNKKKDWKKEMNKILNLNTKKYPNHPLNCFLLCLKK